MNTGGISGGSSQPEKISIPGLGTPEGASTEDVKDLLSAKVSTLGELKAVMIKYLGEKEGMKLYNTFLTNFGLMMLQQMQESASQAQKASQGMRMDTPQ